MAKHRLIESGQLILFGTVGERNFEDDGFTPREVVSALALLDGDLTVRINSWGGIASDGIAIFNALQAHNGKITTQIDGIAASAASIIVMAGEEIIVPANALLMIHNASASTHGTKTEHLKQAEVLGIHDEQIAVILSKRTGLSEDGVQLLMDAETWMTGVEAKKMGFATKAPTNDLKDFYVDKRVCDYAHVPEAIRAAAQVRPSNVISLQERKNTMTSEELKKIEADAMKKATAEVKAEFDQRLKDEIETLQAAAVKAKNDAEERAKQITGACNLAGLPDKAVNYISSDKSVGKIIDELEEKRVKDQDDDVTGRVNTMKNATTSWDKTVDAQNAQIS